MRRSMWSSTVRAAVVLPALLVVLLTAPLPVAATPEGEIGWTASLAWTPAGEAAFLPGVDSRIPPRPVGSMLCSAPTVTPELLQTRK